MRPVGGGIAPERLAKLEYYCIHWSIDSKDWMLKSLKTEEIAKENVAQIVNNVMKSVKNGSIILMHEIYQNSYDAFCEIIRRLYEQGYQCVTVSELLGDDMVYGIRIHNKKIS